VRKVSLVLGLMVCSFSLQAGSLETLEEKYSYAMGARIGEMLLDQGVSSLNMETLSAGIGDAVNKKKLLMTADEIMAISHLMAKQEASKEKDKGAKNKVVGEAFLEKNAKNEGVISLDSGLQYLIIKKGTGAVPTKTDKVKVHYRGTLINGNEFDSSYKRKKPATFPLDRVVAGFRDSISLMKTGAKWKVFIPSDLGYGARGAGADIGPNETLIFEIELLEIVK